MIICKLLTRFHLGFYKNQIHLILKDSLNKKFKNCFWRMNLLVKWVQNDSYGDYMEGDHSHLEIQGLMY